MPSATTALMIVGFVTIGFLRFWAYRASPTRPGQGADPSKGVPDRTVFRQRLLVYYGAMLLFVLVWLVQGFVLKRDTR
jgi:hypothetical protein